MEVGSGTGVVPVGKIWSMKLMVAPVRLEPGKENNATSLIKKSEFSGAQRLPCGSVLLSKRAFPSVHRRLGAGRAGLQVC